MTKLIEGARQLPLSHLSIRVPWHDGGWGGGVCTRPRENTSCLVLSRVAEEKDDANEEGIAGARFDQLPSDRRPPCVNERATFMAPFDLTREANHPYARSSPETHGHFLPTPFRHPPYSAACIPFRWMLKKNVEGGESHGEGGLAADLDLGYDPEREPTLRFDSDNWVQERTNQLVVLDTFFGAVRPEESLCFFYAKRTPLTDDRRRVIVGVGRVVGVGEAVEYDRRPGGRLRCVMWERNVLHSVRPGFKDGFILPYREVLELAEKDPAVRPSEFVALAPWDHVADFSYVSEHVSHDAAISALLACDAALTKIAAQIPGPWDETRSWIDAQLNRLWEMRGPFPGLGAALTALGVERGNLIAYDIAAAQARAGCEWNEDPWPLFEQALTDPSLISEGLRSGVDGSMRQVWKALKSERRALLKLLSRFALSDQQAIRYYQPTEREQAGVTLTDREILENPYLLYERDRHRPDSVQFETVDRGMSPEEVVRARHPVPKPSALEGNVDSRRVRGLVVEALEAAAQEGHTLQLRIPANVNAQIGNVNT